MNLAYAEVYLTLATILRAFVRIEGDEVNGMRLYETDCRDVDLRADSGIPKVEKGRGDERILID